MPLSRDQAESILAPLVPDLMDSLSDAEDWVEREYQDDPLTGVIVDSSTKASRMSNAFTHFVRPRLLARGIFWEGQGKAQYANIGPTLRLRFKKLNHDLCSMNARTPSQRRLYFQQPLPEAQLVTAATFGYTVSEHDLRINGVYIVCPRNWRFNHWAWPLLLEDDGQMSIFGAPVEPNADADAQQFTITVRQSEQA